MLNTPDIKDKVASALVGFGTASFRVHAWENTQTRQSLRC